MFKERAMLNMNIDALESHIMAMTKQRIPKGVLTRRSGLGQILEFVMPFQNAIPYTQVPQVDEQS